MRISWWHLPVLLPIFPSACEREDMTIHEQSDRLILRTPGDLPVCEGTFHQMETEVIQIQSMFEVPQVTVDYSWLPPSHISNDEFPCQSDWACTSQSAVFARTLMSTHELVHAARVTSLPPPLEEGLAVLFDAAADTDATVMASREELREALDAGTWELAPDGYGLYERLAHFVSFLFAEYGQESFIEFEQRIRRSDFTRRPLSQWATEFEAVYGESFDQAWETYASYPDCPPAQFHLPLTVCTRLPSAPLDASLLPALLIEPPESQFTATFECDSDNVVGPIVYFDGTFTRSAKYYVDINNEFEGTVWLRLVGEVTDATRAIMTNCGNCWDGSAAFVIGSTVVGEQLHSGRHALILYQDLDATGDVGIALHF